MKNIHLKMRYSKKAIIVKCKNNYSNIFNKIASIFFCILEPLVHKIKVI